MMKQNEFVFYCKDILYRLVAIWYEEDTLAFTVRDGKHNITGFLPRAFTANELETLVKALVMRGTPNPVPHRSDSNLYNICTDVFAVWSVLYKGPCECGGTKTKTTHSHWCPVYEK